MILTTQRVCGYSGLALDNTSVGISSLFFQAPRRFFVAPFLCPHGYFYGGCRGGSSERRFLERSTNLAASTTNGLVAIGAGLTTKSKETAWLSSLRVHFCTLSSSLSKTYNPFNAPSVRYSRPKSLTSCQTARLLKSLRLCIHWLATHCKSITLYGACLKTALPVRLFARGVLTNPFSIEVVS